MSWTIRDAERDKQTIEAIERLDDRGAANLAASFIEDRLTLAIKARFYSDRKAQNKLFEYPGALSAFSQNRYSVPNKNIKSSFP